MSRASALFRLHEIDRELERSEARIANIQGVLADSAELRTLQKAASQSEAELAQAATTARSSHAKVEDQRAKLKETEASLYGGTVTEPRQLEELQLEAESLKRYLATLEDRYLESMLEQDEVQAAYDNAAAALEAFAAELEESHGELISEQSTLDRRVKGLHTEREAALASVSEEDLLLYERLRETKRGQAVALVEGNSCSACGLTLTPAVQQQVRSGGELAHCGQCGRILYGG